MARKSVPVDTIPSGNVSPILDDANNGTNGDSDKSELIYGFESINPGDAAGTDSGDSGSDTGSGAATGKRRGRPPGSTNTSTRKTKTNLGGLESILLSLHAMASGFLEVPELALDPEEAKTMADAAAQVASHYNHVMNPKVLAWVNLAMVCGGVYGTRFAAVRIRMKIEAANKPTLVHGGNNVREIKPVAPPIQEYAYQFRPDNTPQAAE